MGVITAFMTAFYMFRMWFMTFAGEEGEATKHATHTKGEHVALTRTSTVTRPRSTSTTRPQGHARPAGLPGDPGDRLRTGRCSSGTDSSGVDLLRGVAEAFDLDEVLHATGSPTSRYSWRVGGIALAYFTFYKKKIDADAIASKPAVKAVYNMLLDRYGFTEGYD